MATLPQVSELIDPVVFQTWKEFSFQLQEILQQAEKIKIKEEKQRRLAELNIVWKDILVKYNIISPDKYNRFTISLKQKGRYVEGSEYVADSESKNNLIQRYPGYFNLDLTIHKDQKIWLKFSYQETYRRDGGGDKIYFENIEEESKIILPNSIKSRISTKFKTMKPILSAISEITDHQRYYYWIKAAIEDLLEF